MCPVVGSQDKTVQQHEQISDCPGEAAQIPRQASVAMACRRHLRLRDDEGSQAVVPDGAGHRQNAHHTHAVPEQDLTARSLDTRLSERIQRSVSSTLRCAVRSVITTDACPAA